MTPDARLHVPISVPAADGKRHHQINWIDSKAMFGDVQVTSLRSRRPPAAAVTSRVLFAFLPRLLVWHLLRWPMCVLACLYCRGRPPLTDPVVSHVSLGFPSDSCKAHRRAVPTLLQPLWPRYSRNPVCSAACWRGHTPVVAGRSAEPGRTLRPAPD